MNIWSVQPIDVMKAAQKQLSKQRRIARRFVSLTIRHIPRPHPTSGRFWDGTDPAMRGSCGGLA